jgi:hypothetical protein
MRGLIPGSSPTTKGPAMTFLEFERLSPTLSSLRSDVPPYKGEGEIHLFLTFPHLSCPKYVPAR